MDNELIVLDRTHALIVATGEVIPTFAGGTGGGGSSPPPPSAEEKASLAKQTEATQLYLDTARKSQATADALEPYLYKQLGLEKKQVPGQREQRIADITEQLKTVQPTISMRQQTTVPFTGNNRGGPDSSQSRGGFINQTLANPEYTRLTGELAKLNSSSPTYAISELPKTPEELQRGEIQDLANKREIAALKGDLPVDPSVESDINRGQSQLQEELARRGVKPGSGDIYNRAISEYQKGANALRYGVRTGQMTTADAIASGRQLELQRKQSQYINQATQQNQAGANMLGTGAGLYGDIGNIYADQRFKTFGYQNDANKARAAGTGALIGAGVGAVGIGAAFAI